MTAPRETSHRHVQADRAHDTRIVQALRGGLYEARPELRLKHSPSPELVDLMRTAADDHLPAVDRLPLLRLRTLTPVLDGFDPIETTARILEIGIPSPLRMSDDQIRDAERRRSVMAAVLAATITPEMRARSSGIRSMCGISALTPWSRAHVVVLGRPAKTDPLLPMEWLEIDPAFEDMIGQAFVMTDVGRTLAGRPIRTIEAVMVMCEPDDLPNAVDALRTLSDDAASRSMP